MNNSLIFDTKRYAINDGPGIRVTVFFKGCPLSCIWCHNPEGLSAQKQKVYTPEKCIACGDCVEVCQQDACRLTADGIVTDNDICILCGDCAKVCPSTATEMSGEHLGVEHLVETFSRDKPLMDQSGGGVTFSGGEPLMHPQLLMKLLDACGDLGIHRCIDTGGMAAPDILLRAAQKTELFLYDLKVMNAEKHKQLTGVSNENILNNLELLAGTGVEIIIRIPLLKNLNDDDDNLQQTAAYIAGLQGESRVVNLLPYHNSAEKKHLKLGQDYDSSLLATPSIERQDQIIELFKTHGIQASIGG